jgi:hypothetical protein
MISTYRQSTYQCVLEKSQHSTGKSKYRALMAIFLLLEMDIILTKTSTMYQIHKACYVCLNKLPFIIAFETSW